MKHLYIVFITRQWWIPPIKTVESNNSMGSIYMLDLCTGFLCHHQNIHGQWQSICSLLCLWWSDGCLLSGHRSPNYIIAHCLVCQMSSCWMKTLCKPINQSSLITNLIRSNFPLIITLKDLYFIFCTLSKAKSDSVKSYSVISVDKKIYFILSISKILSQKCYHCVHYWFLPEFVYSSMLFILEVVCSAGSVANGASIVRLDY